MNQPVADARTTYTIEREHDELACSRAHTHRVATTLGHLILWSLPTYTPASRPQYFAGKLSQSHRLESEGCERRDGGVRERAKGREAEKDR